MFLIRFHKWGKYKPCFQWKINHKILDDVHFFDNNIRKHQNQINICIQFSKCKNVFNENMFYRYTRLLNGKQGNEITWNWIWFYYRLEINVCSLVIIIIETMLNPLLQSTRHASDMNGNGTINQNHLQWRADNLTWW